MKILVTGGAGFIGTNLIKRLVKEGHKVSSIDNYDSGLESNHQLNVIYKNDDITNISRMPHDFDKIFHLAALSRIQPSFNNPSETFRVNALGTQKVLDFARNIGAKVVYAGSSSRWHDPYQSPYAACKHIGEEICKTYKKTYGMDIEIARFYNVYGPGEIVEGDWAAVIGIWRRQANAHEPITIVGDGEQRRDFTHVEDIVDGLYRIGFKTEVHEDAWELGTGMNYSINEVYLMFKERFGINFVYIPEQPGNYRKTLRENNDTVKRLNWKPTDKLRDYILSLSKN
jgi:UDP-glucose 4-epimerase|tara:strand:- start:2019 stop:2873 length:855 start_codon:yes stop_codon:yes gene_type:complete